MKKSRLRKYASLIVGYGINVYYGEIKIFHQKQQAEITQKTSHKNSFSYRLAVTASHLNCKYVCSYNCKQDITHIANAICCIEHYTCCQQNNPLAVSR